MKKNTWYKIVTTPSNEAQGRITFTIGEVSLVFDVIKQYTNVSLGIVQYTGKLGLFSVRVCSGSPYRIDICSTKALEGTPAVSVVKEWGVFNPIEIDEVATGNVVAIISTEDNVTSTELEGLLDDYYDKDSVDGLLDESISDWDENDPTKRSYVKNRTHYRTASDINALTVSLESGSMVADVTIENGELKSIMINTKYLFLSPKVTIDTTTKIITTVLGTPLMTLNGEHNYHLGMTINTNGFTLVLIPQESGRSEVVIGSVLTDEGRVYFGNLFSWTTMTLRGEGISYGYNELDNVYVPKALHTDIQAIIDKILE